MTRQVRIKIRGIPSIHHICVLEWIMDIWPFATVRKFIPTFVTKAHRSPIWHPVPTDQNQYLLYLQNTYIYTSRFAINMIWYRIWYYHFILNKYRTKAAMIQCEIHEHRILGTLLRYCNSSTVISASKHFFSCQLFLSDICNSKQIQRTKKNFIFSKNSTHAFKTIYT